MNLGALIATALPPLGKGIFLRDRDEPRVHVGFVVVNAWHAERASIAAAARTRGAEVWVYGGPSHFRPENWRESLVYIERVARELGAVGVIADPENGWPSLGAAERRRELRALGEALAALAADFRVGVSFFPGLPDIGALAEGCAGRVFAVVQVYGRDAFTATAFAGWVGRAKRYFGEWSVSMAIAGWPARTAMETREGFELYLSMLPAVPSVIVWDEAGAEVPRYIADALNAYEPGGSALGSLALGAGSALLRPAGLVVASLVVLVVIVAALAARSLTRA